LSYPDPTEGDAAEVLEKRWGVKALSVKAVPSGRVNRTFLAEAEGKGALVLQRLSPNFGGSPALGDNWDAVFRTLDAAGVGCLALLPATDGSLLADGPGWSEFWRLSTFVEGHSPPRDAPSARAAAKVLGACHSALNRPRPIELVPLPEGDFTNQRLAGPSDFESFETLYRLHPSLPLLEKPLERGAFEARALPASPSFRRIFLLKDLVIHLDPKRGNFLEKDGRLTLIDWDTVSYGDPLLDLAELCRSFAAAGKGEDAPVFDSGVMREALSGYRETGLDMGEGHFSLLPSAVRGVVVNLARRYLADSLVETYFHWDRESYPSLFEQNVSRAGSLLDLAEELREREFELMRLVKETA
jgi:Ser/Thr protein kinase RdoA (MazF antagonist)